MEAIQKLRQIPGVKHIVSRLGRGESPVDPAGYNEADMMIQLAPLEERKGITQDEIAEKVREVVASMPGVNIVMAQPISDRVDEMVTGVRADEAAIGGEVATEVYEGERRFQAVVRFPEHLRNSVREIRRTLLTGKDGEQIPLESLVHMVSLKVRRRLNGRWRGAGLWSASMNVTGISEDTWRN